MTEKVLEHYFYQVAENQTLKDVADCYKGRNITGQPGADGPAIINLSDIHEGQIAYEGLKRVKPEDAPLKHQLQEGDVLVASKGTVKKIAVFEEQDWPVIASANLSIIRLTGQVRPHYLKLFLESPTGQAMLDAVDRGKTVLNISRQGILSINLPKIPLVKQDYLVSRYLQGLKDYQRKIGRAQQEWDKIQQEVEKGLF